MSTVTAEIRIVQLELTSPVADIGAAAAKSLPASERWRYAVAADYVLETGERVSTTIRGLTHPKLAQRVESTKNNIERGAMFAQQYDFGDGPYWSFVTKYLIGLR